MFLKNKKKKRENHPRGRLPSCSGGGVSPLTPPTAAGSRRHAAVAARAAYSGCGRLPQMWRPARPTAAAAARAPHASSRGLNRNVEQQISKKGSHIAYLEGEAEWYEEGEHSALEALVDGGGVLHVAANVAE